MLRRSRPNRRRRKILRLTCNVIAILEPLAHVSGFFYGRLKQLCRLRVSQQRAVHANAVLGYHNEKARSSNVEGRAYLGIASSDFDVAHTAPGSIGDLVSRAVTMLTMNAPPAPISTAAGPFSDWHACMINALASS